MNKERRSEDDFQSNDIRIGSCLLILIIRHSSAVDSILSSHFRIIYILSLSTHNITEFLLKRSSECGSWWGSYS